MTRIITFFGGETKLKRITAIAAAKSLAQDGERVLLITLPPITITQQLLEISIPITPLEIAPNLHIIELRSTILLQQLWDHWQKISHEYKFPSFSSDRIFGGELAILPGMDSFLIFNKLRQYLQSDQYDYIIYDSRDDLETLRLIGIPTIINSYLNRFQKLWESSDLNSFTTLFGATLASIFSPIKTQQEKITTEIKNSQQFLDQASAIIETKEHLSAYLITTPDPTDIEQTLWFWGSSQQINLNVLGVLAYQTNSITNLSSIFNPLKVYPIPNLTHPHHWENIITALPKFSNLTDTPKSIQLNWDNRQIILFLPGFNHKQVKVSQSSNLIIIEAGDQRRIIPIPSDLEDPSIKTASFNSPYLTILL